ncbi:MULTISPECIES: S24 family peptidase [Bacillaceae]|uniref:LexA family protein n=1 Tax=Bacillaceae TaxID=186817 RepID=UPI001EDB7DD8|nr:MULTISPECIES: S24 family peptidase [Bacillaceae]UPO88307.1 helix-turn-helix domain-containing protein [Niallia sp. Man26]
MSIGKNIKRLREQHNLTQEQLANIIGVSDKAVSTWESELKTPRMGTIQKIADHFGILKSDIIEDKKDNVTSIGSSAPHGIDSIKMPLLGSISAGVPLEMIEVQDLVNVPREVGETYPDAFLLEVIGDSMNKVIPEGALALLDPTIEISNGDIAAVAVNGYDATLKRVFKHQDGVTLEPLSYNPEHKTQFYSDKDMDHCPVSIKGKLVWYMAPLDIKF